VSRGGCRAPPAAGAAASSNAAVTVVALVYFVIVFRIRRLIPDPELEALPESYI
jgi:hypothetical protein